MTKEVVPGLQRKGTLRVAILSDTHGFLDARVGDLVRSCDIAVHAGDIGCAGILRELTPRNKSLLAVRGNNDIPEKWPAKELSTLDQLPVEGVLDLPGGKLVVTHGDRAGGPKIRHERLRQAFADARAIVYGHSHRLVCDLKRTPWVLNPGSAGRSRTFGGPSCLLLAASKDHWKVQIFRFAPLPKGTVSSS